MSEQIIQVLDYLGEKFGIAIDWASANVYPQIEELAHRFVVYNIWSCVLTILLGIAFMVGGIGAIRFVIKRGEKLRETGKSDWAYDGYLEETNGGGFAIVIVSATLILVSFIITLAETADLLRWIVVPEMQLIEYVANYIQ